MAPPDLVPRGQYHPSPIGRATFCGLRMLDPLLQRYILHSARLASIFPNATPVPFAVGQQLITTRGLHLTSAETVVFSMSVGSAIKQIFWVLYISKEPFNVGPAIGISIFNTINNSIDSLLFTIAASNPTYVGPYSLYVGAVLYTTGLLLETVSEVQRKTFKDKPENQGKLYRSGLFGLARHINYGGYTIWRCGYALACGGPVFASLVAAFFTWDFTSRAIPVLQTYGEQKYGEQYKAFENAVLYKLFPGVY